MSLMEGLLLDAVYNPPVVTQNIFIAKRSDASPGSGTLLDPYGANSAADFDNIFANKITTDSAVFLGPGTFQTSGHAPLQSSKGLEFPQHIKRLVGAGRT